MATRLVFLRLCATAKRFVPPVRDEGFDELYVVRPLAGRSFEVRSA